MKGGELHWRPAIEIAAAVRAGRLSPVEVIEATLSRIEAVNPRVNAFCAVDAAAARARARRLEAEIAAGSAPPLAGVPFSVKDLIPTRGLRTTGGSRAFADHVPRNDAEVVARLRAAGAILLGKTNTFELGQSGEATDNELFGPTLNPWNLRRPIGGSSGGAAAAVALGCGPIALGTDDGGSVRIPAHHAGVVGFKPSFGRTPRFAVPFPGPSPQRGHVGPLARTVLDAALAFDVIAGAETLIACRGAAPPSRLGWCTTPFAVPACSAAAAVEEAAAVFRDQGLEAIEVDRAFGDDPMSYVEILSTAELAEAVGDADWLAEASETVRRRVARGRAVTPEQLAGARRRADALRDRLDRLFEDIDLLLTPVLPFEPGEGRAWTSNTVALNVTGMPAISIPLFSYAPDWPCGVQLIGRRGEDARVLAAAAAAERARPWLDRRPP